MPSNAHRARLAAMAAVVAMALTVPGPPAYAAAAAETEPYLRNLAFPTNLAFAPDGRLFYTEKDTGSIRIVENGRVRAKPFDTFAVTPDAERGLLGIALDPDFDGQPWVYVYYSDGADGVNRLARVRADGDVGGGRQILLEGLDSSSGYHNGGDLAFGTDGTLFVSVGEAHDPDRAQDVDDVGGKVLRLNPDGTIPPDNPFGSQNPVWSYGHRNSFGLCVDPRTGELWETENGPDVDDEINLIEPGGNYGWPMTTGRSSDDELTQPVAVFPETIAVTGCTVVDGNLFFGSFDGRLWWLPPSERRTGPPEAIARFDSGVTDVALGPDGVLAVATSDAIWRVDPSPLIADEGTASPSPGGSSSSTASDPTAAQTGDDGGAGVRGWIALAAALALGVGLVARFAAGRRLRRAGRD